MPPALLNQAIVVSAPIEWGDMTLAEGVNDVMTRFGHKHPELSPKPSKRSADASAGSSADQQ